MDLKQEESDDEFKEIEFVPCTLPDLEEETSEMDVFDKAAFDLLPAKSRVIYEGTYDTFLRWRQTHKINCSSEATLIDYFNELSMTKAPSTLYAVYSMLKKTIRRKEMVDIGSYPSLSALLKQKYAGFASKKSAVLSSQEVRRFLSEAPDVNYLATKVVLVIGVMGGCRSQELVDLRVQDIREEGKLLVVSIPKSKTKINKPRSFVIPVDFVDIVKKYQALRPASTERDRFFLCYRSGKCINQVIGTHKIASMPRDVAEYLKLENPETYTGNCFRRTSATMLANEGGNMIAFRDLNGSKSNEQSSVHHLCNTSNANISNMLLSAVDSPSTSARCESQTCTDGREETKRRRIDDMKKVEITDTDGKTIILNNCIVHIHQCKHHCKH